jgi:hypothetical protein
MVLAPAPHARQQPALRERRQQRDADALRFVAGSGRGRAHAVVELRQCQFNRAQQRRAGGIEHQPAAAAVEQGEADLLLEQLDLLAEGAVRQVQCLGGRAQVCQLRDDTKGGQGLQRQAEGGRRHLVRIANQRGQNKSLPLRCTGH